MTSVSSHKLCDTMLSLLFATFLLNRAFTLTTAFQVNAIGIVEKKMSPDISSSDLNSVNMVEEFNTAETLLIGYLHKQSYPTASSGCVGLIKITSVELNACRFVSTGNYAKTVATSTAITTTNHRSDACLTVDSTVAKSYTAGVCDSQIVYSISARVTSDLTLPRVTKRSDYYYQNRLRDYFIQQTNYQYLTYAPQLL